MRRFFTENALYWLLEYRFDGLRFDAVHAIAEADWLDEMSAEVRATVEPGRHVHLVLEHEGNVSAHLRRDFDAQREGERVEGGLAGRVVGLEGNRRAAGQRPDDDGASLRAARGVVPECAASPSTSTA